MTSTCTQLRDQVGRSLDARFHIVGELAPGPSGCVFRALDVVETAELALKVFSPSLTSHAKTTDRLVSALKAAAELEHPSIIRPLAIEQHDALVGYAMKLTHDSLESRMRRGIALPTERIMAIAQDVAAALDYGHGRGLVHGGVKPSNILFDQADCVYLADFGIEQAAFGARTTYPVVAQNAQAYHSPEVRYQRPVDGRADQYSLAVVIYELLTGQRRVDAPVVSGIQTVAPLDVPAVLPLRPDAGLHVNAALRKALSPMPNARFPSVEAFIQALVTAPGATQSARHRSTQSSFRRAYLIPLAVGAVIVACVLSLRNARDRTVLVRGWQAVRRQFTASRRQPPFDVGAPAASLDQRPLTGSPDAAPRQTDRPVSPPAPATGGLLPGSRAIATSSPVNRTGVVGGNAQSGGRSGGDGLSFSSSPQLVPSAGRMATQTSGRVPSIEGTSSGAGTTGDTARTSLLSRLGSWFGIKSSTGGRDASGTSGGGPAPLAGSEQTGKPGTRPGVASGQLTVTVDNGSAIVIVDGAPRGTTPLTMSLGAGSHTVSVRSVAAAYEPAEATVSVASGATASAAFYRTGPTLTP